MIVEDVTDRVEFENSDDECLPLTKCVCAAAYGSDAPEEQVDDSHAICPYCHHQHHVEAEDYDSNEREQECAECGKTYLQCDEFAVTHYTRPCPRNAKLTDGCEEPTRSRK